MDTETTDIPKDIRAEYNDVNLQDGTWPWITEISWQVLQFSEDLHECLQDSAQLSSVADYLLKPTFSPEMYSKEAQEVTGISYESLADSCWNIEYVLRDFINALKSVDFVVSHNATFDMKVVKAEMLRNNIDQHLRIVPWVDTMWISQKFVNVRTSKNRLKYPTLTELYRKIYDSVPLKKHTADSDVDTLIKCFNGLVKNEIITPERIKLRIEKHVSSDNNFR